MVPIRTLAFALLAAALVIPAPARAQDDAAPDAAASDDAPVKPAKWDVADPGGPYRTFSTTATEGTWMSVDVSPDGRTLVFDLLGDLWTLPIEGGDATLLSGGLPWEGQPRWSPDGKTVLFTSDRGGGDNLWLVDADGENRRPVTKETYRLMNSGSWHPSGEWVVGHKHFTSGRSLGAGEMWQFRVPEGGAGVRLTKRKNDQQDAGQPVFSPDGRFLWWCEDMSGGSTFEYNKDPNGVIYVVRRLDLETGEIRDVIRRPGGAVTPRPSPDGKTLAFVRRVRNRTVLALLDIATGAIRDLWDGLARDQQETWAIFGAFPGYAWTPDGAALVVWGRDGGLHRVDAATGEARKIPFRCAVEQRLLPLARVDRSVAGPTFPVRVIRWPQVAADGRTAVFQALGRLWARDLPDGAPRRLTAQEDHLEAAPRLTPAGDAVVYVTWDDATGGTVRRIGLDGSGGTVLLDWPGHYASAAQSADGRDLVVQRAGGDGYRGSRFATDPGIWRVRLDRDEAPRLVTRGGRDPVFTPDGRRILLQAREGGKGALVSVDRLGSDRRVHATGEHVVDFELSPDGRWLAWEELWQTWIAPFPASPDAVTVGAGAKNLPVVRLSGTGGTYLSWSADSATVRWSLGPDLFEARPDAIYPRPDKAPKRGPDAPRGLGAPATALGWAQPVAVPRTDVWLVGGTILPMDDLSVIEDGVVHVVGDRIVAVGTRMDLPVPDGAAVLDCTGKVVMPGFVDTHSHTGSSNARLHSEESWAFLALLAFGVTTVHDPSNDTQMIHAEAELVRAGLRTGPRVLSTGTILYGAEGDFKAVINSLTDAREAVARTVAWGGFSVKSYQQPRREQRQQVLAAARELGVMVVPEGGSTFPYNLTHILDGHTTIEHAIPVAPLREPMLDLFAFSGTCYTPTLTVGYGGLWGENYWYAKTRVWEHERLLRFVPRTVVDPNARRRVLATDDAEYHHVRLAASAGEVVRRGGHASVGAHGQLQGLGSHWEAWMFAQGGLTPHEALRVASHGGAYAIGLDHEIGAVRPGFLADLIVLDGGVLEDIRRSDRVQWTIANGVVYDAATLERLLPDRRPAPALPDLGSVDTEALHAHCACGR